MQIRPRGSGHGNAQGTRRNTASYDYRGNGRQHSAAQRKDYSPRSAGNMQKGSSPARKILLGKNRAGQTPIWRIVIIDILVFGLSLVSFSFFHHAMPRTEEVVGVTSSRNTVQQTTVQTVTAAPVATAVPTPVPTAEPTATVAAVQAAAESIAEPTAEPAAPTVTATPEPTYTPAPTAEPGPDPVGYFGNKYADKFTDGEVKSSGTSYQSANVNVTATKIRELEADVFFVDIYVKDISCLRAELAKGKFGKGISEWPLTAAKRIDSVVLINGDYYGARSDGVVIRNGVLCRDETSDRDVCVLYWDGTMKCFGPKEFDAETEMANGAYQAWNFGPSLLDADGKAITSFDTSISIRNPRAVIGYYEPGHYCLVVVDGRSTRSRGLSLTNLAAFFERMGCKAAYNLDGGATATMVCGTELINNPYEGGRACSDFVVVVDEVISGF